MQYFCRVDFTDELLFWLNFYLSIHSDNLLINIMVFII